MLSRTYVQAIRGAGGAVVTIPPCRDAELLRPVYGAIAGLLLAGGGDVQPELYGQPVRAELRLVEPERDATEVLLARWAMEDGLPILAICRGIQVLNVALGGTLIQDIPSQVPGALAHNPLPKPPRSRPTHEVHLVGGSRVSTILGLGRPVAQVRVNSFHHQAVDAVASALRVAARAPDGVIEALECPDRGFVIGVQWHPEEMVAGDPAQKALFAAFVEACATKRP